jgi:alkylation response protein AidB-like acyl-CoA dehydrogenase
MDFSLTDEQTMLRDSTRDFAWEKLAPAAKEADENGFVSKELLSELANLGYCGIATPTELGGAGMDTLSLALAIEEISQVSPAIGLILATTNVLVQQPILKFGTQQQIQQYIPELAAGRKIGAFCLAEASAGSDLYSIETTAVKQDKFFLLNGVKKFVSNGKIADTFLVFARHPQDSSSQAISAFIVEKNFPGIMIGKEDTKLGLKACSTTEVQFTNCEVPLENLLGSVGNGPEIIAFAIDMGRILIGAQALGISEGALKHATEYSQERHQFGQPIANFQAIQFKLADIATHIEASRLLVYQAAVAKDLQKDFSQQVAMAKLFASEAASMIVHQASQVFGGYGYMREYPIERLYRDQKATEIYYGTSEILRNTIAQSILK